MDLTAIRTGTRWLTNTNSTTFTDTDLDREANIVYSRLVMEMVQASGHLDQQGTQVKTDFIGSTGLSIGDLGYNGEHPLPTDCLVLSRLEARFFDNLAPVTLYDASENTSSEFENYSDNFSSAAPSMRFFRKSVLIRPQPETTVSSGLYMEYIKRNSTLDSETAVFEANFHDLIPLGVAMRYFMAYPDKYNAIIEREYKDKLEEFRIWYRDRFPQVLRISPKRETF